MATAEAHRQIKDMQDAFERSAKDYFVFNTRDTIERENGLYGFLIAKPIKRLISILEIDRELLILLTSFVDQQPRTIETAQHIIERADLRMEPNLIIVVHKDPRGNAKLKDWGREVGIAVLPIYSGLSGIPAGEKFEKILAHELYSHDPFDVTGPVADDARFFGRRTEAVEIARKLQSGSIKSCFGIRKIGKTSIIHRIVSILHEQYDCVPILVDCSGDSIFALTPPSLAFSIHRALINYEPEKRKIERVKGLTSNISLQEAFDQLSTNIQSRKNPVILIFDEVDYITPSSPTAAQLWRQNFNTFWRNLRVIYQDCAANKIRMSILVSGVSSKWFAMEEIDHIENAALSFVPEDYLSPLPRGAATAMIRKVGRMAGLQFSERSADIVASKCSDMPFWIRKAASFIHQKIDPDDRPRELSLELVEQYMIDFVQIDGAEIARVALRHLFRVYPELKVAAMDAIHQKKVDARLGRLLQKYGVLSLQNKDLLSGQMVETGLKLLFDDDSVLIAENAQDGENSDQRNVDIGSQTGFSSGDWAEELALMSKRANLLERNLRDICLRFMQFDYMNNKKTAKTPLERIGSAIPARRREELQGMSAEDLTGRLYWKELCALIEKEWGLFDRMFHDKKEFQDHVRLVNGRPWAHAKDIDLADVALYRRSFEWFEGKMSS